MAVMNYGMNYIKNMYNSKKESNKMESKTEDIMCGRYVPTPETKDGMYQEDKFGNFRIVVREEESKWVDSGIASLVIDGELFIGVSSHLGDSLPSKCVLKVQKADENGDTNFYKFKVADLCQDIILDCGQVADILRENMYEEDYAFFVKDTKRNGFVKIKIIQIFPFGSEEPDIVLNEVEVTDFLIDSFDSCDYDVIDIKENKIN